MVHYKLYNCILYLVILLNDSRFSEDFIWYGKLFQILGPKTLKLLLPKVTWLCTHNHHAINYCCDPIFTFYLFPPPQPRIYLGHILLSSPCTRHFFLPAPFHAPIFSCIYPLGGIGNTLD